jgi:hypothetical protein
LDPNIYLKVDKFLDLGDDKDGEMLDYDEMKREDKDTIDFDRLKKEESVTEDKKTKKKTKSITEKSDNKQIADLFKAPKPKNPDSLLRKYILDFVNYDSKLQANEIITETDELMMNGKQGYKIDKQFYVKEIQKCFSKWNKNKSAPELLDALNRLTRETSELDKSLRLQKEVSNLSVPSLKEDKKRKKSYVAPALVPQPSQIKEVKEPAFIPVMKKMYDQAHEAGGTTYRDQKKLKEKENSDELLYLFYEEPLTDQEFESMFKLSV